MFKLGGNYSVRQQNAEKFEDSVLPHFWKIWPKILAIMILDLDLAYKTEKLYFFVTISNTQICNQKIPRICWLRFWLKSWFLVSVSFKWFIPLLFWLNHLKLGGEGVPGPHLPPLPASWWHQLIRNWLSKMGILAEKWVWFPYHNYGIAICWSD